MQQTLSEQIRLAIQPILDKAIQHPFLAELHQGTLSTVRFTHYLQQDHLYLQEYYRCLQQLGRASNDPAVSDFVSKSLLRLTEEINTQYTGGFLSDTVPMSRSVICESYANFLLHHTANDLGSGLAALYPCYWMYLQVAQQLLPERNHEYSWWFEYYNSVEFQESCDEMAFLIDRFGDDGDARQRMISVSEIAAEFEYLFWDQIYRNTTQKDALHGAA